jgi:pilus assembly protein CpaE
VVIDLGVNYSDITLMLLDASYQIHFITSMELAAVQNAKQGIEVMKSLNYSSDKVKIFVNQVYKMSGMSVKDIEKAIKMTVHGEIEEQTKIVRQSMNIGDPMSIYKKYKHTKFVKQVSSLAQIITK